MESQRDFYREVLDNWGYYEPLRRNYKLIEFDGEFIFVENNEETEQHDVQTRRLFLQHIQG